jgi:hypothetical protein
MHDCNAVLACRVALTVFCIITTGLMVMLNKSQQHTKCEVMLSQDAISCFLCSFGVPDNAELPHISFPLLTNVDSLIVTKPGEQPPELGQQLHEDAAAKKERTAAKGFGALDVDNIYTCMQHTCMLVFLLARPDASIRPCYSFHLSVQ